MKLTSKVHDVVKPESASPVCVLPLSNMDLMMNRFYIKFLFFFQPQSDSDQQEQESSDPFMSSARLKASLSRALAIFYPLAGRYKLLSDQRLEVDCCDAGAEFYEACADAKLSDFHGFEEHDPRFEILSPCAVLAAGDITKAPLLMVQVTKFQCGGLALVVAGHDNVADGVAMGAFIKAWSQICAGNNNHLVPPPCFDRSLLTSASQKPASDDDFDFDKHDDQINHNLNPRPASLQKPEASMFKFSANQLRSMKAACKGTATATRFEVLAGHIWKCVTKARGLNSDQETKLVFPVDGRSRLAPDLPDGYCGSVICYGIAASKVEDLLKNPFPYAVSLVRTAKERLTSEYVRSSVDWIQRQENPKRASASICNPETDCKITSWGSFPLYEADFGWGNPIFASSLVDIFQAQSSGFTILLPSPDQGMNTVIGLYPEHKNSLLADPSFLNP